MISSVGAKRSRTEARAPPSRRSAALTLWRCPLHVLLLLHLHLRVMLLHLLLLLLRRVVHHHLLMLHRCMLKSMLSVELLELFYFGNSVPISFLLIVQLSFLSSIAF